MFSSTESESETSDISNMLLRSQANNLSDSEGPLRFDRTSPTISTVNRGELRTKAPMEPPDTFAKIGSFMGKADMIEPNHIMEDGQNLSPRDAIADAF